MRPHGFSGVGATITAATKESGSTKITSDTKIFNCEWGYVACQIAWGCTWREGKDGEEGECVYKDGAIS